MIMLQHLTATNPHTFVGGGGGGGDVTTTMTASTTAISSSSSSKSLGSISSSLSSSSPSPPTIIHHRRSESMSPMSSPQRQCHSNIPASPSSEHSSSSPQPMTIVEDDPPAMDGENLTCIKSSCNSERIIEKPTIQQRADVIVERRKSASPAEPNILQRHQEFVMLYNHLRQCKTPPTVTTTSTTISPSPSPESRLSTGGSPATIIKGNYQFQQARRSVITTSGDEEDDQRAKNFRSSRHPSFTDDSDDCDRKDEANCLTMGQVSIEDHDEEEEDEEDRPLDLSLSTALSRRRARTYSGGTEDSDDSGAGAVDGELNPLKSDEGRAAYKKNLMKRYSLFTVALGIRPTPPRKCDYKCTRMDQNVCANNGICYNQFPSQCQLEKYNCLFPQKAFNLVDEWKCDEKSLPQCSLGDL